MTYKEIKDKTPYEILDLLEMKEPPFNPFTIAQKLGINVVKDLDLDKIDTEGQISVDERGEPIIWINPLKNENRQRFTLAHELGHLANDILPSIENPIIDSYETLYRSNTYGGIETRANQFAAKLLMPLRQIEDFIAECRKKNNLTQMQIAEKLDITDRAISKWENGKAMPDSSIMLD